MQHPRCICGSLPYQVSKVIKTAFTLKDLLRATCCCWTVHQPQNIRTPDLFMATYEYWDLRLLESFTLLAVEARDVFEN